MLALILWTHHWVGQPFLNYKLHTNYISSFLRLTKPGLGPFRIQILVEYIVLCISHFTCISVLSASKLEQNSKILDTDLLNLIWSWALTSSKNYRFHWKKCKKQQICVGPLNVTKTSGKFFHLNIVLYRTQGESITEKKTQDQSSNCIVPVSVPHSIIELNPIETDVKNYVHLDSSLGRIILSYMSWSEKIELVFFRYFSFEVQSTLKLHWILEYFQSWKMRSQVLGFLILFITDIVNNYFC